MKNQSSTLNWIALILLSSCFLFYGGGCKKQMDKARKHYDVAVEYHKQELFDQAIAELQQAIKIDPNYAEAHYELGVLYHEKEDYANALQELQQAIKISPDYAEAYFRLGIIYQVAERYDLALREFEEVLRINPNFPRIHTAIGSIHHSKGVKTLVKATRLDWSYLIADTLKEISYKNKDELKKAIENYITATQSDTTNSAVYSKLGQAYCTLAQDEYQKAIAVDSLDTAAQLNLGLTFLEKGYPNKAMVQYEILKNLDPRLANMLLQEIRHKEQEAMELKRRGLRK